MLIGKIKLNLKAGNIRDKNDIAFEGPITGLFSQNSINTENFTLYLPVAACLHKFAFRCQ